MAEESFWFIFLSLIFSLLFRQMLKLIAGLCFHYENSESLQEPGAGFHSLSTFPPSFLLGRAGHGMLASEGGPAGQGRRVPGLTSARKLPQPLQDRRACVFLGAGAPDGACQQGQALLGSAR